MMMVDMMVHTNKFPETMVIIQRGLEASKYWRT